MDCFLTSLILLRQAYFESEVESSLDKTRLFLTFFRIGWIGFGGSVLALVEQDLVKRQRVLAAADITEALTYTKLLPGSTVVQVVSYLGWRLAGWGGSAAATVAFIVPSFVVMLAWSTIATAM